MRGWLTAPCWFSPNGMANTLPVRSTSSARTPCSGAIGAAPSTIRSCISSSVTTKAIDFAIANKLKRVEAGAQGAHKLARGYLPTTTYSAHWIAHEGLHQAVADFLEHERLAVERENEALAEHAPFRKIDQET